MHRTSLELPQVNIMRFLLGLLSGARAQLNLQNKKSSRIWAEMLASQNAGGRSESCSEDGFCMAQVMSAIPLGAPRIAWNSQSCSENSCVLSPLIT